jgi:hypothetical protein
MQGGKGIAVGFAAGLVVAGGALFLLHDDGLAQRPPESAGVAGLDARIERLERSVSRLADAIASGPAVQPAHTSGTADVVRHSAAVEAETITREVERAQALAMADDMVVRALQTGQWTRAQAAEFDALAVTLSAEDQGRLMAKISAAINADQLQVELP